MAAGINEDKMTGGGATRWWSDVRKGVELSPIENNARRSRRNGWARGKKRGARNAAGPIELRDEGKEGRVVAHRGAPGGVQSMGSSEQCPAAFDYNVGRNNRIAHGPLKRLHRLTDDRPRWQLVSGNIWIWTVDARVNRLPRWKWPTVLLPRASDFAANNARGADAKNTFATRGKKNFARRSVFFVHHWRSTMLKPREEQTRSLKSLIRKLN